MWWCLAPSGLNTSLPFSSEKGVQWRLVREWEEIILGSSFLFHAIALFTKKKKETNQIFTNKGKKKDEEKNELGLQPATKCRAFLLLTHCGRKSRDVTRDSRRVTGARATTVNRASIQTKSGRRRAASRSSTRRGNGSCSTPTRTFLNARDEETHAMEEKAHNTASCFPPQYSHKHCLTLTT